MERHLHLNFLHVGNLSVENYSPSRRNFAKSSALNLHLRYFLAEGNVFTLYLFHTVQLSIRSEISIFLKLQIRYFNWRFQEEKKERFFYWFSRKPEEKRTRTGSDHADNGVRIEELILEEGTAFCSRLHSLKHPPPPSYHHPSVRPSLPLIEIPSRCV